MRHSCSISQASGKSSHDKAPTSAQPELGPVGLQTAADAAAAAADDDDDDDDAATPALAAAAGLGGCAEDSCAEGRPGCADGVLSFDH
jgi:hypothetical protein